MPWRASSQLLDGAFAQRFACAVDAVECRRRPHRHAVFRRPRSEADVQHPAFDFEIIPFGNENGFGCGHALPSAPTLLRHAPLQLSKRQVEKARCVSTQGRVKPALSTVSILYGNDRTPEFHESASIVS